MQHQPNEDLPEYRAAYAKTLAGQAEAFHAACADLWHAILRAFGVHR